MISRALTAQSSTTRSNLSQKGVTYQDGRLSVRTDRAAPSREAYIASTQRAFEQGARTMSLHPDAFRHGPGGETPADSVGVASDSAMDTP